MEQYDRKMSMPTFLIGDLNSEPDSEEIGYILRNFGVKLKDLSTPDQIGSDITFHGFYADPDHKGKIDYILLHRTLNALRPMLTIRSGRASIRRIIIRYMPLWKWKSRKGQG